MGDRMWEWAQRFRAIGLSVLLPIMAVGAFVSGKTLLGVFLVACSVAMGFSTWVLSIRPMRQRRTNRD